MDVQTCHTTGNGYTRASQTNEQREARNEVERNRWNWNQEHRNVAFNPYWAAFIYNVEIDYSSLQIVAIGPMNIVCQYCKAFKFKDEADGLCCASGRQIDAIGTATRATTFISFR